MHILFLSDNFPPETNAPASRTHEHAKRWVMAGHQVTVVTCAPNFPAGKVYPGYKNKLWKQEEIDGITVVRVWTYIAANEGFVKRSLDYLSFMISATLASLFLPRPDIVVATSPQFFTACAGYLVSRLKRRHFVFELRDLWPDSIVAVGALKESLVIRFFRRIETFLYNRAYLIVSVTRSFGRILSERGIAPEKIVFIPNGADISIYHSAPKPQDLMHKLGLENRFVAAYIGTIGMAHGLGCILDAADKLKDNDRIAFILVGAGAEFNQLVDEKERRGLRNVHFIGPVSKTEVVRYWQLSDAALVLLRDTPLFEHVLPSKMLEAMAMGRPVILGVRGESREVLEAAQAGIAIEPENADMLASALIELANNPERARSLAQSGEAFVKANYNRDVLAARMLEVLSETRIH